MVLTPNVWERERDRERERERELIVYLLIWILDTVYGKPSTFYPVQLNAQGIYNYETVWISINLEIFEWQRVQ